MNCLRILSMTLLLAALSSAGISQNSNQAEANSTFFVRIENLNVDNYPNLYHALKADGRFEVTLACVPMQILTIRATSAAGSDMAKNILDFQTLSANAQLSNPVVLPDFNADRFFEACSTARN
ncbi:MAG: hypothetical protein ACKVOK_09035 [Flavobacteriales bacterium]